MHSEVQPENKYAIFILSCALTFYSKSKLCNIYPEEMLLNSLIKIFTKLLYTGRAVIKCITIFI
jgi:hypothetical protein